MFNIFQNYSCMGPKFAGNLKTCLNWHRQNSVLLNIYYSSLQYETNTEIEAYTVINLKIKFLKIDYRF